MRVFVAGASGAIGRPLIAELVRRGHEVTGMTRSESGARDLAALGAAVARVSAFDAAAVEDALRDARAEVVIDELTAGQGPFSDGRDRRRESQAEAGGRREPASRRADVPGASLHPADERLFPPSGRRAGRRVRWLGVR